MVTVFLADGFEEIEAITPIDVLRRAGVSVRTCSISSSHTVTGAHGIRVVADTIFSELDEGEEMIVLPGGMPGTLHLKQFEPLNKRILAHHQKGGYLAAICAAPTVFGALGLLKYEAATCYPGLEPELFAGQVETQEVVVSGPFITSRGAGTGFSFALKLVQILKGDEVAFDLAKGMCFEGDRL